MPEDRFIVEGAGALKSATDRKFEKRAYPQVIKYMGSKAKILGFVLGGLSRVHSEGPVCDLFAGAGSLSGAIGDQVDIISNDIQRYSGVITDVYLHPMSARGASVAAADLVGAASVRVTKAMRALGEDLTFRKSMNINEFNEIEERSRALINRTFRRKYHLFVKCYSGTWWSAEQCLWIDALREVIDERTFAGEFTLHDQNILLTSLMHAMAYCGQGTGHYAQYRDAKDEKSLADIKIYRGKSVPDYFARKLESLKTWNKLNVLANPRHATSSVDYMDCLAKLQGGTIYADPPYAFVHYSRFYHAIETLVEYDYPDLQVKGGAVVKGRYREERHQSPFSIKSKVPTAFVNLFVGACEAKANLVLSYSDTGLLNLDEMIDLAHQSLGHQYEIDTVFSEHSHMTMGRKLDRSREVTEALLVARRR